MAKKGMNKTQKTLSAPKSRTLERKTTVWTIKDTSGTHRKNDSVPLAFAIRNLLKLTETLKETKKIINQRKIKVNGKIRTTKSFPIGLFDLIEIEIGKEKKYYRAIFDSKRRIKLIESNEEQTKLCRIEKKKIIKGKKIQITFNDGTTTTEEIKANPGDTAKIDFSNKKIIQIYPLEKGNTAFILSGKHTAKIVKIESIIPGTQQRSKIIEFNEKDKIFKTTAKNIFVIGKDKADKTMELNYNE